MGGYTVGSKRNNRVRARYRGGRRCTAHQRWRHTQIALCACRHGQDTFACVHTRSIPPSFRSALGITNAQRIICASKFTVDKGERPPRAVVRGSENQLTSALRETIPSMWLEPYRTASPGGTRHGPRLRAMQARLQTADVAADSVDMRTHLCFSVSATIKHLHTSGWPCRWNGRPAGVLMQMGQVTATQWDSQRMVRERSCHAASETASTGGTQRGPTPHNGTVELVMRQCNCPGDCHGKTLPGGVVCCKFTRSRKNSRIRAMARLNAGYDIRMTRLARN